MLAQEFIPETQVFLDNTFVFVAAVLVIFMQVGFALVEAGLTRSKSVSNIMMKNMMDFVGGDIMFFLIGYAIAYGPDGSLWFTQGLHAMSKVETPWGIARLDRDIGEFAEPTQIQGIHLELTPAL